MTLLQPPLSLGKKFYRQRTHTPLLAKAQPGILDELSDFPPFFSQNLEGVIE
jgi:hypothetical protein